MTQHFTTVILAALAGVGLLSLAWQARRAQRATARRMREAQRASHGLLRTLTVSAVFTGGEWLAATHVPDWRLQLLALAVPGLLAGWTVTTGRHRGRDLAVLRALDRMNVKHGRSRGGAHR